MFWTGVLLLGLGLAAGWSARRHRAIAWECDPMCRPATSATWRAISDAATVSVALGAVLAAAAFLMIMLRRPRTEPDSGSPQSTAPHDKGSP
ncbi:hypothetical protein [Streptomyces sp. NPDC008125]|uniref:hypothetical protein n=1 Tax=Streptomyces sp. NPDC008125 TaxID=3364811 RepID=UPI0036E40102